ncbi:MAG: rubrerythrin [Betaproteobacteria bacterium]|nr:rubrerythrin [Betaproteobacteria bacterium]
MGTKLVAAPAVGRRIFLRGLGAWLAAMVAGGSAPAAGEALTQTVAALRYAFQRETDAHRRYLEFAAIAQRESYQGIAYMFAAFAVSEGVHARNFRNLLLRLGGSTVAAPTPIETRSTKENLIAAVDDEIDSIDRLYPGTLERIRPEGDAEAAVLVTFAWESERQHRDLIRKIRRYSPLLFEQVAKTIDAKTGRYFVCDHCGSTTNQLPSPSCIVCGSAAQRIRPVSPPG